MPRLRLAVVEPASGGPRLCRGCGDPLMPAAVFCSSACRSRSWRRMLRARSRTEAVKAAVGAVCPQCGAGWTVGVEHPVSAVYCSPVCRKRAWHRRCTASGGM
jgi:predicted nucleic acid-binding Zn ribbon protein